MSEASGKSRGRGALLWSLAFLVTLGAACYQRLTGPSHHLRGSFEAEGEEHRYRLRRSGSSESGARIEVQDIGPGWEAAVAWHRWPTNDPRTLLPMVRKDGGLVTILPPQPPAGKVEYCVLFVGPKGEVRIPPLPEDDPVLRFRADVPIYFLAPHILLMFIAILVGVRAALAALFHPASMHRLALAALAIMTAGGMILGPIVQKCAFGEFWTGWPKGKDLTDNKMLLMWCVWVGAALALRFLPRAKSGLRRAALILAALVMLAVYLVPHSMKGSELDYGKLEEGSSPTEAIQTG